MPGRQLEALGSSLFTLHPLWRSPLLFTVRRYSSQRSAPLNRLQSPLKSPHVVPSASSPRLSASVRGLHGSSDALALAEAALAAAGQPLRVLTSQALDGQRLTRGDRLLRAAGCA